MDIREDASGFTLIELVIVTLLLGIMMAIIFGTANGLVHARNTVQQLHESSYGAFSLMQRISRELTSRAEIPITGTGLQKKNTSEKNPFILGERAKEADGDTITFISTTGAQGVVGGAGNVGNVQITYKLARADSLAAPGENLMGSQVDNEGLAIFREEIPAGITDQDVIKQRKLEFRVLSGVTSLRFRYFTENSWKSSWGADDADFPDAVEISIKVKNGAGSVDTYRTAVSLLRE